ncbi:hypothetical protein LP7551_05458 [Roseibium album]|nr:hypothetical protein LP7551_05458 [Roseibium album]
MNKDKIALLFSAFMMIAAITLLTARPGYADGVTDTSRAYVKVEQDGLLNAYLISLADAGESATDNLYAFRIQAAPPIPVNEDNSNADKRITVHAIQDRGQPRGAEYPTYVFATRNANEDPALIYKTHAGTRIFFLDEIGSKSGCLLSAEQGYSDICLADIHGNPAPDLPGLRDDFWTDLMKLLGL